MLGCRAVALPSTEQIVNPFSLRWSMNFMIVWVVGRLGSGGIFNL